MRTPCGLISYCKNCAEDLSCILHNIVIGWHNNYDNANIYSGTHSLPRCSNIIMHCNVIYNIYVVSWHYLQSCHMPPWHVMCCHDINNIMWGQPESLSSRCVVERLNNEHYSWQDIVHVEHGETTPAQGLGMVTYHRGTSTINITSIPTKLASALTSQVKLQGCKQDWHYKY